MVLTVHHNQKFSLLGKASNNPHRICVRIVNLWLPSDWDFIFEFSILLIILKILKLTLVSKQIKQLATVATPWWCSWFPGFIIRASRKNESRSCSDATNFSIRLWVSHLYRFNMIRAAVGGICQFSEILAVKIFFLFSFSLRNLHSWPR